MAALLRRLLVRMWRRAPRDASEFEQHRDQRYRRQLLACKVHVVGNGSEFTVRIPYTGRVPMEWFTNARYAVCLDYEGIGSVPATARIDESGDGYRVLTLTSRHLYAGYLLRRYCRIRRWTERSNVVAILVETPVGSTRLPNVLYDVDANAMSHEPNLFG